uniref:Uncharacterized protein n=1 Tax=Arundo donax TaxID=35708 RepID=A0A0A9F0W5_ARUDO
MQKSELAVLF